jgi:prepilin signal peptidase PulO-like enzyme (type II secretory pathway)
VETTKYAYQGAYVEICARCYTKYSRRLSSALTFSAIASVLAVALFLILVVLLDKAYVRTLGYGMLFAVFIIVGLFTLAQSFCDSKHFSWKTVLLNDVLPRYGVPDYHDSPYHEKELVSEEHLLEAILNQGDRDGD